MEKGGPFIDVVCRTRYIGRDCRSIDHAGVAFEGLLSTLRPGPIRGSLAYLLCI